MIKNKLFIKLSGLKVEHAQFDDDFGTVKVYIGPTDFTPKLNHKIDNMIYCTCKDKKVINEGDAMFIAYESYCPKHGYFSSCYMCGEGVCTTELCNKHRTTAYNTGKEESKMIETDINKRWEAGTPHHLKSVELFTALAEIDWEFGGDYFCWKRGGDGDNGETMMYEMDIYFEELDSVEWLYRE